MTNTPELQANSPVMEEGLGSLPYLAIKITGFKKETPNIISSGTGFFYSVTVDGQHVNLIVTNKHVVDGLDMLMFHFGLLDDQGNRILGKPELVGVETKNFPFFRHPNDDVDLVAIAAQPFLDAVEKRGKKPFFLHLNANNLPPEWLRKRLVASTSILMVGFPNGLMDEANNLPLVRKGILATPFTANHNGEPNFVVDIAAFGGSSGSPVFAFFEALSPREGGGTNLGESQIYLIGVLHSGPQVSAVGEVTTVPVPTSKQIAETSLMMHLGYCLRAELIEDMVDIARPFLQEEQKKLEQSKWKYPWDV